MITETAFASGFTSIWRSLTPMSEVFVRRINGGLYSRMFPQLNTATLPARRALTNEVAFNLFTRHGEKLLLRHELSAFEIDECFVISRRTITHLDRVHSSHIPTLDETERADAVAQAARLATFFLGNDARRVVFRPEFKGCGIIDACNGDILIEGTLYEVKAGDRRFRSVDIRQLLVYLALNFAAEGHKIRAIGLFNPRIGVSFEASLEQVCFEVSGQAPSELLGDIVQAFSSGEMSR